MQIAFDPEMTKLFAELTWDSERTMPRGSGNLAPVSETFFEPAESCGTQ